MEFTAEVGEQRYAALVRAAAETIVGLDFDGTLAPIVEDPSEAHIHPDAGDVLVDLAGQVLAVAVVTGRPARQALDLGGLEWVGNAIGDAGKELYLFGQYGNERWSSTNRRVISPRPPPGLASFTAEVPRLLRRLDAEDAHVEEKGLAVAVHTRRLPDAERKFEALLPELEELAARYDLVVEPGKQVIEVRSPGMHKGSWSSGSSTRCTPAASSSSATTWRPRGLRGRGCPGRARAAHAPGLLGLRRGERPVRLSDVLVHGPEGVLGLLRQLTADAAALRA